MEQLAQKRGRLASAPAPLPPWPPPPLPAPRPWPLPGRPPPLAVAFASSFAPELDSTNEIALDIVGVDGLNLIVLGLNQRLLGLLCVSVPLTRLVALDSVYSSSLLPVLQDGSRLREDELLELLKALLRVAGLPEEVLPQLARQDLAEIGLHLLIAREADAPGVLELLDGTLEVRDTNRHDLEVHDLLANDHEDLLAQILEVERRRALPNDDDPPPGVKTIVPFCFAEHGSG